MSSDLKRFKLVHDPEYQSQMLRRADGNWTPYDEAAAELTRLRAQVEAADNLAEAGDAMIDFHNGPAEAKRPDIWQRLLQRFAAAMSAYKATRQPQPTEYEIKLAQLKDDFPNGI